MDKMTRVDALSFAINALTDNAEVVEVLTNIKNSIERHSSAPHAPTKTQIENIAIKEQIVDAISTFGMASSCTEIAVAVGISAQKCSALLGALVKEGKVVRVMEKRKTFFGLPTTDQGADE